MRRLCTLGQTGGHNHALGDYLHTHAAGVVYIVFSMRVQGPLAPFHDTLGVVQDGERPLHW